MGKGICPVVEDGEICGKHIVQNGMCSKHYGRWYRHGDPLMVVRNCARKNTPAPKKCSVEDCDEWAQGLGLCKYHWQRQARTGDPLGSRRKIDPAPEGMKTCGTCGDAKPLADFYRHPEGRLGRQAHCKACTDAKLTARYWADPEKHRAKVRTRRAEDPEAARRRKRELYQLNAERERQRAREWAKRNHKSIAAREKRRYREDPEYRARCKALAARYRQANPEKAAETVRRWREANPVRVATIQYRYRQRQLAQWVEDVDPFVVYERDGGACGICGGGVSIAGFHVDHVIPLSRGGEHSYANVQLAHPRCNQSKGSKLLDREDTLTLGV